ncbi:hypothetical protein SNEBB_001965, partial [Seison nebaliae]
LFYEVPTLIFIIKHRTTKTKRRRFILEANYTFEYRIPSMNRSLKYLNCNVKLNILFPIIR